jgi:hypothetical protein
MKKQLAHFLAATRNATRPGKGTFSVSAPLTPNPKKRTADEVPVRTEFRGETGT